MTEPDNPVWPRPEGDEFALNECSLDLLVQIDEAVRCGGDLSVTLSSFAAQPEYDGLGTGELAAAALCMLELEAAYPRMSPSHASDAVSNLPPNIGRFEITGLLGSGGFGLVYRGRDPKLNRLVAVKVPRNHAVLSNEVRQRFVREAHAAAQLDHPHIVPIYEAGEVDGLPFIAYAYCDGPNLARWCNDQPELMSPEQAARLTLDLARAVAYSHSRGILHRDIKPSNVLLFPDPQGQHAIHGFSFSPKLTDLGLAKNMNANMQESMSTLMMGTPTYMSPEQGRDDAVGPTSDVYSLGATLYFLLTGRPPFVANKLIDLLRQLAENDPVEPATLNPAIDLDLNTICVHCLEKQPRARYESAEALAEDLNRYLSGLPILARPVSTLSRIHRWCYRKPAMAVLISCVCALALGLMGTLLVNSYTQAALRRQLEDQNQILSTTVQQLDRSLKVAEDQKRLLEESGQRTRQLLYVTDMQAAGEAWNRRDYSMAAKLLNSHEETKELREFSWRLFNSQLPTNSQQKINLGAQIWNISSSADGTRAVVSDARGLVHMLTLGERLTVQKSWDTGQREVNSAAFSPDGQWLATAGDDGRIGLWKAATGEHVTWLDAVHKKPAYGVQFFDDGRKLIACGDFPDLPVWNVADFQLLTRIPTPHPRGIESISVSPDGKRTATVGIDGVIRVFRLEDGALLHQHKTQTALTLVQFDPAGRYIAAGDKSGRVHVLDADSGAERFVFKTNDAISALTMGADDQLCFSNRSGVIYYLNKHAFAALTEKQINAPDFIQLFATQDRRLAGLLLTKDGRFLSGSSHGDLELWSIPGPRRTLVVPHKPEKNLRNRRWPLVSITEGLGAFQFAGNRLENWDLGTAVLRGFWSTESELTAACLSSDESHLIAADVSGSVFVVPIQPGNQSFPTKGVNVLEGEAIARIRTLKDGQLVVAQSENDYLVIHDMVHDRRLASFPNRGCFDISPDQRWIVTGNGGTNAIEVIDADSFASVRTMPAHTSSIWDAKFSHDGSMFFTTSGDRSIHIWNPRDWSIQRTLLGHLSAVRCVAVTPDNLTIATCDESGKLILWYAASGQKIVDLALDNQSQIVSCEFSPDGQTLVVGTEHGAVHTLRADQSVLK